MESRIFRALEMLTVRNIATNLIPEEDFVTLTLVDKSGSNVEFLHLPWTVIDESRPDSANSKDEESESALLSISLVSQFLLFD